MTIAVPREPRSACPYDAEVAGDAVMSNFDQTIRPDAEELLRGDVFGRHAGWSFNARVWLDKASGQYRSEVWRYGSPKEVLSARTLKELMIAANDRYGWE